VPLFDQIMAVVFVLGLALAALWLARRRGLPGLGIIGRKNRPAAQVSIIERVPLTGQHTLHLVRVGGDTLLVATFPGGIQFAPRQAGFMQVFHEVNSGEQPQ